MNSIPRDATLDRAMVFAKNHRPSGGLSNLYVIKLLDDDGNLIDEKYGMNLFTDYGIQKFLVDGTSFPNSLYIGNGSGTITRSSQSINSVIGGLTGAYSGTGNISYEYPLYYDPEFGDGTQGGLITCVAKYKTFNLTNMLSAPEDRITEYGVGTANNELWTHSWVYASNGEQTYINTHDASTIQIDVYLCFSYYENIIINGRSNGIYTVISTMERFMNKMRVDNVHTYKKNNIKAERSVTRTSSAFMDNKVSVTYNLNSFTLSNTTGNDQGYIDGFVQYYSGFTIVTPETRTIPEAFTTPAIINTAANISLSKSWSDKFGEVVELPFTRATITDVVTYDANTNTWEAPLRFNAAVNHDYCETPMQPTLSTPIWYTVNNAYQKMYVFQNIHTDDDILTIQSTCETIYAATKYWDCTTWVRITNYSSIPAEYRNYPYWIASSNTAASKITTTRASGTFYLKPHSGGDGDGYSTKPYSVSFNGDAVANVSNPQYNWFALKNKVYAVDDSNPYSFTISGYSGDYNEIDCDWFTYGKWGLCIDRSANIRLYDMTNIVAARPNGPVPSSVSLNFTNTTYVTNTYITETKTGIFCFGKASDNEAIILDLRGNTPVQTKLTGVGKACSVGNTTRVAYYDNTSTNVKVMDVDSQQTVATLTLPVGFGTPTMMCAVSNCLWITDDTTTYTIDISDGTETECDVVITCSDETDTRCKIYDDIVLLYQKGCANVSNKSFVSLTNDPSKLYDLITIFGNNPHSDNRYRLESHILDTQYTVSGTDYRVLTLMMSRSYAWDGSTIYNQFIDLAAYISGESSLIGSVESKSMGQYIPYGDYVILNNSTFIPVENFMTIKFEGTTPTLTALNSIKSIKHKDWTVEVTNIPTFGTTTDDGAIPGHSN